MSNIVEVAGRQSLGELGCQIRTLFANTGIPGYFLLATEIPPSILDLGIPDHDYHLVFNDRVLSQQQMVEAYLSYPSVQQVLWAVGYMSMEFQAVVSEGPVRFMHHPFRAHLCPWKSGQAWRQICLRRVEEGYLVGTVAVNQPYLCSYYCYLIVK